MNQDSETTTTLALDLRDGPVIIVDDDPDMLLTLELLLSRKFPDKEIYTTGLGQRAIDWLETTHPSFLIADLALPDVEGIHVVLKSILSYPNVPVVIMSGSIDMKDYQCSSESLNNVHYLKKPFKGSELVSLMQKAFKSTPDSQICGMNLVNILQLVSEEVEYAHLEISSDDGNAVITIENKMIMFAATEIAAGKKALIELMEWSRIDVSIFYRRRTNRVNINKSVSALLLEICHQSDEQGDQSKRPLKS